MRLTLGSATLLVHLIRAGSNLAQGACGRILAENTPRRELLSYRCAQGTDRSMGRGKMSGFDETVDWVVVGSGAGSISSGLVMRQAGKSVVVLEKTEFFGGSTSKSGGVMWIPNNRFMDPGEDSPEKSITYLDAVVGDDSD